MKIEYGVFRFTIVPSEPLILPLFKGSTLRGGFGHAFKRVVCILRNRECGECLLKERCVYSYIFETPPPSDTRIMRKYRSAPHPFIIQPPPEKKREYKPDDTISFDLILIGRALDYLPYFIYAFSELGNIGIGRAKGRYELRKVEAEGAGIIYSSDTKTICNFNTSVLNLDPSMSNPESYNPGFMTLNFLTPTRIVYNGHLTIDLEFHILIRNLIRRLSLLYYFHCGGDSSEWDFKGIINKAEGVKVMKRDLRWYDWERYSARQDTRMKMGGFVGKITFKGDIGPFMSILRAGEVLHVGKGTAFGLGRFEIIG